MGNETLDRIYKEVIREHYQEPRNFGPLADADLSQEGFNPLCGDRVVLSVKLDADKKRIEQCHFEGEGCSICMASTSIMTEEVIGQELSVAQELVDRFRGLMKGERQPEEFEGDIEALAGVRHSPVRIKCALLGWVTLKDALEPGSPSSKTE